MSVIGERISAITGKVTSTTVTDAGNAVNLEINARPFGLVLNIDPPSSGYRREIRICFSIFETN